MLSLKILLNTAIDAISGIDSYVQQYRYVYWKRHLPSIIASGLKFLEVELPSLD